MVFTSLTALRGNLIKNLPLISFELIFYENSRLIGYRCQDNFVFESLTPSKN